MTGDGRAFFSKCRRGKKGKEATREARLAATKGA